jgi:molybdopterin converting factor small subunit
MVAKTLGDVRGQLAARTELAAIVEASSFLVNGEQAADDVALPSGAVIDVLPPFAGG